MINALHPQVFPNHSSYSTIREQKLGGAGFPFDGGDNSNFWDLLIYAHLDSHQEIMYQKNSLWVIGFLSRVCV